MIPARYPLILAPTPLHRLDRASEELGIDLWIKRDDLTGFALGGNKGRKIEYLVAEWLDNKTEVVVTCGASESNFVRQLAVACAMVGIEFHAVVMDLPYDQAAGKPKGRLVATGGNEKISRQAEAHLHKVQDDDWEVLFNLMDDLAERLRATGKKTAVVPVGGSSALGAYAFFRAAEEVRDEGFSQIIFASSSGSTQVGLSMALRGTLTKVLGVACDPEPEIVHDFAVLSLELARLLDSDRIAAEEFLLDLNFVGPGYGLPSHEGAVASRFLRESEGIFLDPIYTAKAFACLLHMARAGKLPGKTLFWHTGGIPAVFNEYAHS